MNYIDVTRPLYCCLCPDLGSSPPKIRVTRREIASEAGRPTEEEWREKRSVVYYVRLGDYIKIGHTIHLKERMSSLRVDDMSALMAAEPGYWSREAERHAQFAAERLGRRENFNPSRRLLAHIALVRSKYGDPMEYAKRLVAAVGPHTSVQTTPGRPARSNAGPRIHPITARFERAVRTGVQMNILAALEATPSRGSRRCSLGEFLDGIPVDAAGRDELIRLVETKHDPQGDATRSAQNMAMVLTQLGFETTQNPVLDHRKRACRCYR